MDASDSLEDLEMSVSSDADIIYSNIPVKSNLEMTNQSAIGRLAELNFGSALLKEFKIEDEDFYIKKHIFPPALAGIAPAKLLAEEISKPQKKKTQVKISEDFAPAPQEVDLILLLEKQVTLEKRSSPMKVALMGQLNSNLSDIVLFKHGSISLVEIKNSGMDFPMAVAQLIRGYLALWTALNPAMSKALKHIYQLPEKILDFIKKHDITQKTLDIQFIFLFNGMKDALKPTEIEAAKKLCDKIMQDEIWSIDGAPKPPSFWENLVCLHHTPDEYFNLMQNVLTSNSDLSQEIKDMKKEINDMKKEINDRFEDVSEKLNYILNKLNIGK